MALKDQVKSKRRKAGTKAKGGNVKQDHTGQETGHSWGSQKPPISGPGNRKVRVSKHETGESYNEDSNGNFLSRLEPHKNKLLGLAGVLAGGALLFTGIRKGWSFSKKGGEIKLNTRQTIKRSRKELYAYWRNLENLPNFMSHIKEIQQIDGRRSKWTAKIPGDLGTIDWEAMIEQDHKNEYISWRSIADADIENAGEVRFKDAPGGEGTIVETTISYRPPAGKVGDYAAKLLNPSFEKIVKSDLRQFKKHMEEGGEEKQKSEPKGKILD